MKQNKKPNKIFELEPKEPLLINSILDCSFVLSSLCYNCCQSSFASQKMEQSFYLYRKTVG